MVVATLVTAAFGGEKSSTGSGVQVVGKQHTATPVPAQTPEATPATAAPTSTAASPPAATGEVIGVAWPIVGGCLPEEDSLIPGAPRPYRGGIHEGVDFYDIDNCAFIGKDTEVVAAKAGTVIRADLDYEDLTPDELAALDARVAAGEGGDPDVEDIFRGRQVWIDHGGGLVTRYAHLDGIADGIDVGTRVDQGELIAYVGDSGTPESVTAPNTEFHLHFEIRTGGSYLGQGEAPDEVRRLYEQAFSP